MKITIVTNSLESTDSAVTQGFFLNDWKELEARVPSARIFVATGQRKFHAKAFVLDGIKRDASGAPVRDSKGQLVALEGPEQDVSKKLQRLYGPIQKLCDLLSKTSLGHPLSLDPD